MVEGHGGGMGVMDYSLYVKVEDSRGKLLWESGPLCIMATAGELGCVDVMSVRRISCLI